MLKFGEARLRPWHREPNGWRRRAPGAMDRRVRRRDRRRVAAGRVAGTVARIAAQTAMGVPSGCARVREFHSVRGVVPGVIRFAGRPASRTALRNVADSHDQIVPARALDDPVPRFAEERSQGQPWERSQGQP